MTILVDHEIKQLIKEGQLVVTPYDESLVNPSSLDIRLGNILSVPMPNTFLGYKEVDPSNKDSFIHATLDLETGIESKQVKFPYSYTVNTSVVLPPNGFLLASMLEYTKFPPYVSAELKGKSSLGRLGLQNSHHAGWVDALWSGVLTMELHNCSSYPLILTPGMKIGQLIFYRHSVVEQGYDKTGRYVDQAPGTGSLGV